MPSRRELLRRGRRSRVPMPALAIAVHRRARRHPLRARCRRMFTDPRLVSSDASAGRTPRGPARRARSRDLRARSPSSMPSGVELDGGAAAEAPRVLHDRVEPAEACRRRGAAARRPPRDRFTLTVSQRHAPVPRPSSATRLRARAPRCRPPRRHDRALGREPDRAIARQRSRGSSRSRWATRPSGPRSIARDDRPNERGRISLRVDALHRRRRPSLSASRSSAPARRASTRPARCSAPPTRGRGRHVRPAADALGPRAPGRRARPPEDQGRLPRLREDRRAARASASSATSRSAATSRTTSSASRYHAVIYAVGAQTDRRMGIPGEDLPGLAAPRPSSSPGTTATPTTADLEFDLSAERAVVVGNGNVAIDVARMLALTREELAPTDTADHAIDALARRSRSRRSCPRPPRPGAGGVHHPELLELGELAGRRRDRRPGRPRARRRQRGLARRRGRHRRPAQRRDPARVRAARAPRASASGSSLRFLRLAGRDPRRRQGRGVERRAQRARAGRDGALRRRADRRARDDRVRASCSARSATAASRSPASRSTSARP